MSATLDRIAATSLPEDRVCVGELADWGDPFADDDCGGMVYPLTITTLDGTRLTEAQFSCFADASTAARNLVGAACPVAVIQAAGHFDASTYVWVEQFKRPAMLM